MLLYDKKILKMTRNLLLVFLITILGIIDACAQVKSDKKQETPKWVVMMNDPHSNYFETLKEFKKFWLGKALPEEPFEDKEMDVFEREVGLIGNEEDHELREKLEKEAREQRKKGHSSARDYAEEVRAFKGWMQHIKPWVQEDGTIIGLEEQQKIIDQQRAELKKVENQNKR